MSFQLATNVIRKSLQLQAGAFILAVVISGCAVKANKSSTASATAATTESSTSTTSTTSSSASVSATWSTLQSYQKSSAKDSSANAVTYTASSAVLSGGFAADSSEYLHWIVRLDAITDDDYQLTADWDAEANAVLAESSGVLWAAGSALDSSGIPHWIVRTKSVGGAWATSEDYSLDAGYASVASSLAVNSSGDIFVGGYATDSSGTQHWIVRKKAAGGAWSLSSNYQANAGEDAHAMSLAYDTTNDVLYAGGFRYGATGKYWVVRKLVAGVWSASDSYQLNAAQDSIGLSLAVDTSSNVYASGYAVDGSSIKHMIVRTQPYGGAWSTLDDYNLVAAQNSYGQGVAANTSSTVYATGYSIDNSGYAHWTTRTLGATAATDDDYSVSSQNTQGAAVAIDSLTGNTAVAGQLLDGTSASWLVRSRSQ